MRRPKTVTMQLPYDQDALWYPEFNIVAVAPHLDAEGRERALDELLTRWRQSLQLPTQRVAVQTAPSAAA